VAGGPPRRLTRVICRGSPDARLPRACDDRAVTLTVLIVDDHDEFRHIARTLLEGAGFTVVGEAADGRTAVTEAARLRPALVLLDIQLPDLDGFEVAARLAGTADAPTVVLTSGRRAGDYRRRLAESPAHAFIAKDDLSGAALAAVLVS
jgi:CheY-like chemotaxis protein